MTIKPHNIQTLAGLHHEAVAKRIYYEQAVSFGMATEVQWEAYKNAEDRFTLMVETLIKEVE